MLTSAPTADDRGIAFVAAIPLSLSAFVAPHVRAMSRRHPVTLVASSAPDMSSFGANTGFVTIEIPRRISLIADFRALVSLWRLFRTCRFAAVVSITPKAGLLAMVAGRLARVPVRMHWFTGQVWATKSGPARAILKSVDRMLASCATHLLADSASQRDFLIAQRVVAAGQVTVLARGSVCGVDVGRFRPDPQGRAAMRRQLALPDSSVVALYVGRLSIEKGLLELASAFLTAAARAPELHLVVVGPDEEKLRPRLEAMLEQVRHRVRFEEATARPEAYMVAADYFVLPSYREGFGSTVIEAAACGLPTIASRIYGLTDAVSDDTGVLVPARDAEALGAAMVAMTREAGAREAMGRRARVRAEQQFAQPVVTAAFEAHLMQALSGVRS